MPIAGAEDALGGLIRTFGQVSFDVDGESKEELAALCEAWARHLLVGEPAPVGAGGAAADEATRALGDLSQFFGQRRKREAEFVTRAVGELKGALLDVVDNLWQVAQEDSQEDHEILSLLGELAVAVEENSPDRLRSAVQNTVTEISGRIERRERRRREQLKLLDSRVNSLESDLSSAQAQAQIDPLTQVYNRAGLEHGLDKRLLYGSLTGDTISVLMVDIDHFKAINDQYGHPAGDAFLKAFADALVRDFPRKSDLVARYGGEEFLVVLQDADEADAKRLGERFLQNIRKLRVRHGEDEISTTCSVGVAQWVSTEGRDDLVSRADSALYVAKNDGRDRLVLAARP